MCSVTIGSQSAKTLLKPSVLAFILINIVCGFHCSFGLCSSLFTPRLFGSQATSNENKGQTPTATFANYANSGIGDPPPSPYLKNRPFFKPTPLLTVQSSQPLFPHLPSTTFSSFDFCSYLTCFSGACWRRANVMLEKSKNDVGEE